MVTRPLPAGFAPITGGVQGSSADGDPYTVVNEEGGFWFYDKSKRFFGVRLTHQPSPWTGDYGPMRFMAQVSAS